MITVIIIQVVIHVLVFYFWKNKVYWRGRLEGWKACENMVIKRARENGYDEEKFWKDCVQ